MKISLTYLSAASLLLILMSLAGCCKRLHPGATDRLPVAVKASLWTDLDPASLPPPSYSLPSQYRLLELNTGLMHATLAKTLPEQGNHEKRYEVIALPLPEGGSGTFRVTESPSAQSGLLEKFPRLRTYGGQGIDDPSATVKLDFMPAGFHAYILSSKGSVIIDPYDKGDTLHYLCYYKHHSRDIKQPFEQGVDTLGQRK